jgi:predicted TIM-barrel fold metal-dependent hydrolase
MGNIDCDAHVLETEGTWSFLAPSEEEHRPMTFSRVDGASSTQWWVIEDQRTPRMDGDDNGPYGDVYREHFPSGTVTLEDVPGRLSKMDEVGVDVQVLFSTFFIAVDLANPATEAALARSYNRWMAERTAESEGRLRWALKPPLRAISQAVEELEFGRDHGAVAVQLQRLAHLPHLGHQYYWPLYEKAEELGLVMAVHKATNALVKQQFPSRNTSEAMAMWWQLCGSVAEAFHSVVGSQLHERFPALRWAFLEAGSMWIPLIIQDLSRNDGGFLRRFGTDWHEGGSLLAERNLFVSCQVDDDIPWLTELVGEDNFVVGTDWGHLDRNSDPDAHGIISSREDLDPSSVTKLVDTNGRHLYDLDTGLQPTEDSK